MNGSQSSASNAMESFQSDLDWYLDHARSLAMGPEDCCADQGNYLVAGELFYFLLQPTQLIDDPLGLMNFQQKLAVERLRHSVSLVPMEARSGAPTVTASLADMRHPAWEEPRRHAQELLLVLASLVPARYATEPSKG